jgi:glycosyltransferase involved in cell wall biosynthesis
VTGPVKHTETFLIAHSRPDTVSGAELAIADMIDARRDGLHYCMLTPGEGVLADHYRSRGYDVWAKELDTRRRRYPGLHTVQSVLFARSFRRRGVDAVLCNTFAAAARVKDASRMAGIPCGIYVREYITKKKLHRKILSGAAMVLAVSKDVASHLADMVAPEKLVVAYDHINAQPLLERVAAHRARGVRLIPFDQRHPAIGLIGRITRYKQQDLFVRSIPHVLASFPEARFVVVGAAGAGEKEYEAGLSVLARQLGVDDRIVFMGHRRDAVEMMSELSVCCITSDREPFPRTLLEGQLLGIPVVAADTGGCPEMVEHEVTGILFSSIAPDAPERLGASIARTLADPERAAAMSARAQRTLNEGVASVQPVRRLEELLTRLSTSLN